MTIDNVIEGLTSIVLLSYNKPEDIEENIRSLYKTVDRPFEVIVFDNGSKPEVAQRLRGLEGKVKGSDGNGRIRVVYNPSNEGCSIGRNKAIQHARGSFIATMDDDLTYTPGWLDKLISVLERDPTVAACASRINYPDGTIQWNGGRIELDDNYFARFVAVDSYKNVRSSNLGGQIDCDWLPGGAMVVRSEVAKRVQHAYEYLNGYEDYDYSMQMRELGFRLVNVPDSVVVHHNIWFDPHKQKIYPDYLLARTDGDKRWRSLLALEERTGLCCLKDKLIYRRELLGMNADTGKANMEKERHRLRMPKGKQAVHPIIIDPKGTRSFNLDGLSQAGIAQMVGEYSAAIQGYGGPGADAGISNLIFGFLQRGKDSLEQGSPDAAYFFDFSQSQISMPALYDLIDSVRTSIKQPNDDWRPDSFAENMIRDNFRNISLISLKVLAARCLEAKRAYDDATALYKAGDFSSAITAYDQVLSISPSYVWAYNDKALAQQAIGDLNGALATVNLGLKYNPASTQLLAEQIKLKSHMSRNDVYIARNFGSVDGLLERIKDAYGL